MISQLIDWSLKFRHLILLGASIILLWGAYVLKKTPVDAIPDLSDIQVIIKTDYPGRAPKVVEEQVTYPLTTSMMAVPGAKEVRGYSSFGNSFVYVLFEAGTDLYWARSRVLEYLNQAISKLPSNVRPELGPDATGVGWIYEYALVDRTGKRDLAQLRSLQDWFLKYELRTVPGVAEVATLGGMVKQYQIILDPYTLRAFHLSVGEVIERVKKANSSGGGSILELAEAEYMLQAEGYLKSLQDIEQIPIGVNKNGTPVLLKEVAKIQLGPQLRRGLAELNGQGEVVGGIIVMRSGKNALETIEGVKQKLESLKKSLPDGVEIVPTYDRSKVIKNAINNLFEKLIEESIVVALVCLIFLFHLRSAFVVILTLPLGILSAFLVMYYQGISANIMSLGGIAIAIGAMMDVAIVMVENVHKHMEAWQHQHPGKKATLHQHIALVKEAACEVGPPLFFSLLIITISFLPVFTLQGQEGLLFSPLALTKTYAMAAAAGLSITLVPALIVYLIRGKLPSEDKNPINRVLMSLYLRAIKPILQFPKVMLFVSLVLLGLTAYPIARLGTEFMPPLQEGDLLYMPSTFPSLSVGKATQLLQQTDKLIAQVPEVETVFGKMGRAETATDPAPLEMVETTIQLKDPSQWRKGMTMDKIIAELDQAVKIPGFVNLWVQPIRNRIDMLSTGIKGSLGLKIAGSDLKAIESLGQKVEKLLKEVPGTGSIYAERLQGGRYIDVSINRALAARYGLNISDIQDVINTAIGGETISETIEGIERYPINIRFPLDWRDSLPKLKDFPILTPTQAFIPLGAIANIRFIEGPAMLRLENARPSGWVFIDVRDRDLSSYVKEAKNLVKERLLLPAGYSLTWAGQYESIQRAQQSILMIVPLTLISILFLLYAIFRRWSEPLLIMGTLPFALIGGLWLVYILGYHLSVAVNVGFIALAGVAAEFGVVLLIYLNMSIKKFEEEGKLITLQGLQDAIVEGAVMRVRPKSMTVAIILVGLSPIMFGSGPGSDVMKRIAAPMLGGMITAPILSMFVVPAFYLLWQKWQRKLT
ncbi:MAG: cation transporter [Caedibacter sp. 37-49]|nr:MAG: cation transporter [Caedibacter sp. 37-49]